MPGPVNISLPDGILREAARECRLDGASKSEIVRYAWVRLFENSASARKIVFGIIDDLTETNGRVGAYIPEHEIERGRSKHPDMSVSQIARYALALASGELPEDARAIALGMKPGRPAKRIDRTNEGEKHVNGNPAPEGANPGKES